MKKYIVFIASLFMSSLGAQDLVTNTNWEMDESGTKVVVTYDLNKLGEYRFFDIKLFGIVDGIEFPAKSIAGDVGTYIKAGRNKTIIWDIFKDIAEDPGGSLSVKVVATNSAGADVTIEDTPEPAKVVKKNNTVPIWAGLGGVVSLGGGLLVGGATKFSNAKSDNDEYLGLTTDVEYNNYLNDFDDINKRYKNSQLLMAGGGVILAVGGFILVRRLIDMKKIENRLGHIELKPTIKIGSGRYDVQSSSGMSLIYTF